MPSRGKIFVEINKKNPKKPKKTPKNPKKNDFIF